MVNNENDITKYKQYNKIYIPGEYIDENWQYKINGENITIITSNNCYTQYSSTYCDCYLFNYKNNLISEKYTCNTTNNNPTIPIESITNDINYSEHIRNIYVQEKSIMLGIIILGIIFALFITKERNY